MLAPFSAALLAAVVVTAIPVSEFVSFTGDSQTVITTVTLTLATAVSLPRLTNPFTDVEVPIRRSKTP